MSKEIQLTRGMVTLVDDEDYDYLSQWKWQATKCKGDFYYATRRGGIKMHRSIMNTPKNLHVDHINHNTLDNRKENLRNVTQAQNQWNVLCRKDSTTGIKGIRIHKNKFYVEIKANKKTHCIGYFTDIEKAILARDEAYTQLHGEYSPGQVRQANKQGMNDE